MGDTKKLLILTEAGDKIGFGHYTRCSAIKDCIQDKGVEALMVLFTQGNIKYEDALSLDWMNDFNSLEKLSHEYSTVLIDSYLSSGGVIERIKQLFERVIVIDDYNRIPYKADLIVNPNVFFEEIDYGNQQAPVYGGENFVILRKSFREHEATTERPQFINNVLITFGGSDFRNLNLPLLKFLVANFPHINFSAVVIEDTAREQIKQELPNVQLMGKLTEEQIYEQFLKADLVVSACGQTLHELASMNKRVIGICLDHDQEPNQNFYYKRGFLSQIIKWDDKDIFEKIKKAFSLTSQPFDLSKDGVENIIRLIFSERILKFKKAEINDCERLFVWANDKAVREAALNSQNIAFPDHETWFMKKLQSPESKNFLVYDGELAVGQLRVDFTDNFNGILDYSVDSSLRGKGYGREILSWAKYLFSPKVILKGIVKESNLASQKAFLSAGYFLHSCETIQEHQCKIFSSEDIKISSDKK